MKQVIRPIDLALKAGRKRQSPRTGFVHHFPADDTARDVIPLFENFCFALALCRQKTTEGVLEGKELIERLLAFQTETGNFPIFLHDFPRCWDHHLGLKIAPVFVHLLREFGAVFPTEFKALLEKALSKALQSAKQTTHPVWMARRDAVEGTWTPPKDLPQTANEWFDFIVSQQMLKASSSFPIPFNTSLQFFLGSSEVQEEGQPQALPIEYLLSEGSEFASRLSDDHPHQIQSALLFPFTSSQTVSSPFSFVVGGDNLRLFWNGSTLHSLFVAKGVCESSSSDNARQLFFDLPTPVEIGRDDLCEVAVFVDVSPETSIFINEEKGNVFRFGDRISVTTPLAKIDIQFHLVEGCGDFCGHISRSNRPHQTACKGAFLYEAYDWRIALRTLRRESPCKIELTVQITP